MLAFVCQSNAGATLPCMLHVLSEFTGAKLNFMRKHRKLFYTPSTEHTQHDSSHCLMKSAFCYFTAKRVWCRLTNKLINTCKIKFSCLTPPFFRAQISFHNVAHFSPFRSQHFADAISLQIEYSFIHLAFALFSTVLI